MKSERGGRGEDKWRRKEDLFGERLGGKRRCEKENVFWCEWVERRSKSQPVPVTEGLQHVAQILSYTRLQPEAID